MILCVCDFVLCYFKCELHGPTLVSECELSLAYLLQEQMRKCHDVHSSKCIVLSQNVFLTIELTQISN